MNQNPNNSNQVDTLSTMVPDEFSEDDIALAMALSLSASIQSAAETMPPYATANRVNETGTSSNDPGHTQASTDGSQTNAIWLLIAVAQLYELAMALSASIQSVEESVPSYDPANLINEAGTSSNNPSNTQVSTDGSQTNEIRLSIDQNSDNNNQVDPASIAGSDTFSEEDIALAMALSASIQPVEETVPFSAPANLIDEAETRYNVSNEIRSPSNQNHDNSDQVDTTSTVSINTYSAEDIELAAEVASASIQYAVESDNPSATASLTAQTAASTSSVSPDPTQSRTSDNNNQVDSPSTEAIDTDLLEEIELAMAIRFSIESADELMSSNAIANLIIEEAKKNEGHSSPLCVICLDASVEGACVPCGHMNGCMHCLNEIKAKNLGCPLCRAKIDQVIRIYV